MAFGTASALADVGEPGGGERQVDCQARADEPVPIERLTAPPGSFWWINNDGFDIGELGPVTGEDGVSLFSSDEEEIVVFSKSFAAPVPADAPIGATFSARSGTKQLVVGGEPLSASATITSVVALDRRVQNCSCDNEQWDLRVAVEIDGGPAIVQIAAAGVEGPTTGFLVPASTGEQTIIVPALRSGYTGLFGGFLETESVQVTLMDVETLTVTDERTFDVEGDLPVVQETPALRKCAAGCGCAQATASGLPAFAIIVVVAVSVFRRRQS